MMNYGIVFIGAGIGGALRHGVNLAAMRLVGTAFPAGTMTINVVGSLLMGVLAGWFAFRGHGAVHHLRLFAATGILGGFTTFSAFSLDAVLLLERHQYVPAAIYIGVSVAGSIAALLAGLSLMRAIFA